jgi:hypothetical protein
LMIVGRLFEVPIENSAITRAHADADIHAAILIFARWSGVKTR